MKSLCGRDAAWRFARNAKPSSAATQKDEDAMIRFPCECGKQLQGREENAGRQVLCPSCGRQQTIPDASDDAIQARASAFTPTPGNADISPSHPRLDSSREEFISAGTSGKATTSLILGILSLFCNLLTGLPAIIVGILALRDIGRSRERLAGRGLATAGILTASVGTLLSCVLGILFLLPALLLPAVQKVREAAARAVGQQPQADEPRHAQLSRYARGATPRFGHH